MKASNIFQKLKSAGIGNPDGVSSKKPVIKGLGVQSPAKMKKPSPSKMAVGLPGYGFNEEGKYVKMSGKGGGGDKKKKSDPYAKAAKKDPKLGEYVKARKGLDKNSDAYKKLQNKINAAYGVSKRYKLSGDGGESNTNTNTTTTTNTNTNTNTNTETNTDKKVVTKTDTAKENLSNAKQSVKDAKSEVKDTRKAKRIQKRADKKTAKAKRIKETGGTRVGNFLRKTFKKKDDGPVKMKKSAMKMNKGFDKLPASVQAKIKKSKK